MTLTRTIGRGGVPALLLAAIAIAGCGSSSSTTSSSASTSAPAATTPAASTPAATTSTPASTTTSTGGTSAAQNLAVAANPEGQLKFDKTTLSAKAGNVTIAFANSSTLGHNLTIASESGAVVGATPTFEGGSKSLTVNLKPGTYKFYCSVPGHRQAGMEGTLTVQ